jgi:hypothetical protein
VKPLTLFGVIVVVGLVVIGAALHFTDHSASATPPLPPLSAQEQFVRAGNGLCARFYDELMTAFEGRGIPKTATMKAKYLRLQLPLQERLYAGLRALVPPDREAGTYRRLLSLSRRGMRDVHAGLHAYATGQVGRVALIERDERRVHLNRRANSLSRTLGLTICALNDRQIARRYG